MKNLAAIVVVHVAVLISLGINPTFGADLVLWTKAEDLVKAPASVEDDLDKAISAPDAPNAQKQEESVDRWPDASGYRNDMTASVKGAIAPTFTAHGINGRPAVVFSGDSGSSGAGALRALSAPLNDEWKGATIILVGSGLSKSQSWFTTGSGQGELRVRTNVEHVGTQNAWPSEKCKTFYQKSGPQLATVTCGLDTKGAMCMSGYANGELVSSSSDPAPNYGVVFNGFKIGYYRREAPYTGEIYEVLVYKGVLTDEERRATEAYLMGKYGIAPAGSSTPKLPVGIAPPKPAPPPFEGQPPQNGLLLWCSADSLKLRDGQAVESLPNRAGKKQPPTSDDGKRPVFSIDGVGGRPQISFEGHPADSKATPPLERIEQALKIPLPQSTAKEVSVVFVGTNLNKDGLFSLGNQSLVYQSGFWQPAFDGRQRINSPLFDNLDRGQLVTVTVKFDDKGGTLEGYLNGLRIGHVTAPADAKWSTIPINDAVIGNANVPWSGSISEVLIYNHALSEAERTATESYLSKKYSLPTLADREIDSLRSKYSIYEPHVPAKQEWACSTFNGNKDWVQSGIFDCCVTSDGTVIGCSYWDEAHKEIGWYKDGKALGGYRGAAQSLATDGDYLYIGGIVWKGQVGSYLKRWALKPGLPGATDQAPGIPDISVPLADWPHPAVFDAPYVGSVPDQGLFLEKIGTIGIVPVGNNLAVTFENVRVIRLYDKKSGQLAKSIPLDMQPGKLAAGKDGTFWAVVGAMTQSWDAGDQVREFAADGQPTGKVVKGLKPTCAAIDSHGRLLVGDNGERQQVVIFDISGSQPRELGTLGQRGGVYGGNHPGDMAPDRLFQIHSLAVDGSGNLLVHCPGLMRQYSPDAQMKWQIEGNSFCTVGDIDTQSPTIDLYSGNTCYSPANDADHPGDWKWTGLCTHPPRSDGLGNGDQYEEVRRFNGRLYRIVHGKHMLEIQIQEPTSRLFHTVAGFGYGENWGQQDARPAGIPDKGRFVWCDRNDDGQIQPDEINLAPAGPRLENYYDDWLDERGDLWLPQIRMGLLHIPLQGWTPGGSPVYDLSKAQKVRRPDEFIEVTRCYYFPGTDTMYLAGTTWDHPSTRKESWGGCGRECIRYNDWSKPSRHIVSRMRFPQSAWTLRAMSVVNSANRVFVGDMDTACVFVYDSNTGKQLGILEPDAKVVGPICGWIDGSGGVRARQLPSGELIVLTEDCVFGRQFVYRLTAPK